MISSLTEMSFVAINHTACAKYFSSNVMNIRLAYNDLAYYRKKIHKIDDCNLLYRIKDGCVRPFHL